MSGRTKKNKSAAGAPFARSKDVSMEVDRLRQNEVFFKSKIRSVSGVILHMPNLNLYPPYPGSDVIMLTALTSEFFY